MPIARRALPAALLVLGSITAACGGDDSSTSSTATSAASSATSSSGGAASSDSVLDCGIEVPVADGPKKIFAVYQPAIEIAHALGLSDQLVGTAYIDNTILPEYAAAQDETKYYTDIPSKEELLQLDADFIISGFPGVFTDEGYGTRASLAELGIDSWLITTVCPTADGEDQDQLAPATVTMETVYENLTGLGEVFGKQDEAAAVIADMQAEVDAVQEKVTDAPKPSVAMLSVSKDGYGVYGTADPVDEAIKLAGGTNVFADLRGHYNPKVSDEELIKRSPDVIMVEACCDTDLPSSGAEADVQAILSNPALANIPAVKDQQVYSIGFADVSGGVRLAHTVTMIAKWLHPTLVD